MEKEGFVQYLDTVRAVFGAVTKAASSLLEMNAMNVSPTEKESVQLQSAFVEIGDHIRRLKKDAQEKIGEYNSKKEQCAAASQKAIEEHAKMQENLLALEKENADAKAELAQKRMEKDNYEREYRESEAKLAEVSRRKDEEIRKNQEKKELEKVVLGSRVRDLSCH